MAGNRARAVRRLQQRDFFGAQRKADAGHRVTEVMGLGGADQRQGDARPAGRPRNRHLGRRHAAGLGHLLDGEFGGLERVAVLDAVAIDPAAQRQGLARKLVGEFDRNARERGASEMRTQAQWDRPGLVEFFSAAGFRLSPRLVLERPTEYVNF